MKKIFITLIMSFILSSPAFSKINYDGIKDVASLYNSKIPIKNTVYVCSGYGCRNNNRYTFNSKMLSKLKKYFANVSNANSEREALRKAISFIETRVGVATGTFSDKASIGFFSAGKKDQMDCVDEALNSSYYVMIMINNGMIKYHDLEKPNWKGGLTRWTHYAAVIKDRTTGVLWAIDSGVKNNGGRPLIIQYSRWYN